MSQEAQSRPAPLDWCYVAIVEQPSKPEAIALPAGVDKRFAADFDHPDEELGAAIPAPFEGEEYRTRADRSKNRPEIANLPR